MKCKLFTLFFLFTLSFGLHAQDAIWEANFDDGGISTWTNTDVDGDGTPWEIIAFGTGGSNCLSSASWTQAAGPINPDN